MAIFLMTVVAALGAFAMRLSVNHQQSASLQVVSYRVESAARAGIEAVAHRVANRTPSSPTVPCPAPGLITIGDSAGNEPIRVELVSCVRIVVGAAPNEHAVYEIAVEAQRGTFGEPNFVRRTVSHRIFTLPPNS